MGIAAQYKQKMQYEQNLLDGRHLHCTFCGIDTQVRWYAWTGGNWVTSKPAYDTAKKKLMCAACARVGGVTVTPTWKSLSPLQREVVRSRCFTFAGSSHVVNKEADHNSFAFLAHFYPCHWLGEKDFKGTLKSVTPIRDCYILTFVPDAGQDGMVDSHVSEFGYIFSAMPLWYYFDYNEYPLRVQFYRWYDDRDIGRTNIKRLH